METDSADARGNILTGREHLAATLRLGLPLVGAQLAQVSINTTDVLMLGWYGTRELAASVLATQAFFLVFVFGLGFTTAVLPLAAQAAGAGDDAALRRAVRMGGWITVVYGLAMQVPLWYTESILLLLKQDPELAALAGTYMRIAQWGLVPALLATCFRSYLSAVDAARIVFWATIAGVVLNAGLNYALIFGNLGAPQLGISGAAIASVGTNLLITILLIAYCTKAVSLQRYTLFIRIWRPDWFAMQELLKLGWPIGITIIAESGLFIAAAILMGWLGTIPLAAHGIAIQLAATAFMIQARPPSGLARRLERNVIRNSWMLRNR